VKRGVAVQRTSASISLRALAPGLAALAIAALTMLDARILNDGDTYWHLTTGAWILDHGSAPTVDSFSFTRPGAPWVAHEWLAEVIMALAYRLAGWSGVVVLFAMAAAGAAWLLVRRLASSLGGVTLALTAILAIACWTDSLLARPHLLAIPLLLVWTIELLKARDEARAPRLPFTLLIALWANLHGSFVLAFAVAGAFGLEALIEAGRDWPKVVRAWAPFAALSLAATLATPYGVHGLLHPFQIMGMTSLPDIVEWRAPDFSRPSTFEFALLAAVFVCLSRGVRVPVVRVLLLLGLLHMTLQHGRHQMVLATMAPLLLATPLAAALGHTAQSARPSRWMTVAVAILLAGLAIARIAIPITRANAATSPVSALAAVPSDLRTQPVFNDYGFGGYLIFKGVRPFVDGRTDMYGDAFNQAYFAAGRADQAKFERYLDRYGVRWTLLRPGNRLVSLLDADPAWERLYADRVAVVHRRRASR
jgi:hypothetical protein